MFSLASDSLQKKAISKSFYVTSIWTEAKSIYATVIIERRLPLLATGSISKLGDAGLLMMSVCMNLQRNTDSTKDWKIL